MGKSSGEAAAFSHPYIIRHSVIPNVVRNLLVIGGTAGFFSPSFGGGWGEVNPKQGRGKPCPYNHF